ncbi:hypothetical protein Sdia_12400 [Streptomyces diastaticus subsp. diastaticus]|uniref:Uncharacterized protein n=1 Tax=Streptomyces diastaticus subsp. diastaticus TaxID=68040 RepID=A0ABQ1CJY5_STRDI|nr:hypothetical protein [Streptomyces diastaticus]GFH70472.1 hypothetical protein Sdia_12400 [Streptomyces diastaticus subsp. diastaticus]GGU47200.1 hypothetical protein GCM10015534_57180 [Streptomyces diastaticus subsp. diastaticus]
MRSDVEVRAVGTARYPEEFKQDAIKLVASAGSSIDSGFAQFLPRPMMTAASRSTVFPEGQPRC